MTTRRIVLIVLGLLLAFGVVRFIFRSVQIRGELAKIAAPEASRQEEGVRNLMAQDALFDALQGGAPPKTRLNAIEALERIAGKGNEKQAFDQLLQMLKDPDTESAEQKTHPVRDRAKAAVAKVGTLYTERLLDAAKDPDAAIRDQSRGAISTIGAPLQEEMAARLGDSALRGPFGDILAGIGPQTVPLVVPYLQAPKLDPADSGAKVTLIETMGKYKLPAEPKPEDPARIQDAARSIIPFKDDANPNVRRTVITSLSNLANPVGAQVLIEALNNQRTDSDARAAAAGALGAIATPEANAAMVKALSDYDLRVATAAAAGLKRAGDKAAGAVGSALANPDAAVRARAAEATGGMTTVALATRALKDPDPGVRAAAASALGDLKGQGAIGPLINALADPSGAVSGAAGLSLSRIGQPAIARLVARLGAGDTVAYYASQTLRAIGRDAVAPLLAVAQGNGPGVRWAAITLGEIGDTRAASALETLAASSDPDTAWAASVALTKVKQG